MLPYLFGMNGVVSSWIQTQINRNLLARMCAMFPASQWSQLKMGRLLEVGAGRKSAPNGWRKQTIVVIVPSIACGLSSADQAPSSMKINTNAAIVNPQVRIMKKRCQANHWSLPHSVLPTQVCLKYRANKMPIDAVPIHAIIINAACKRKNNFDVPPNTATSAK